MKVMLISLVKAVSEMCSNVFVRVLFVQFNYRLHFQVTTMSGAAVINEIENSCHYIELSRIFLNQGISFCFQHLGIYMVIFLNTEFPC